MIDLEDLKLCYGSIKLIYLKREKFNELIQALEQAKSIFMNCDDDVITVDLDNKRKEWLSRYFPRKEES